MNLATTNVRYLPPSAPPALPTITPEVSPSLMTQRAMLVSVKIKLPPTAKQDKAATKEVTASHNADESAAKVQKQLYDKPMVEGFKKASNATRQALYEATLPWGDGSRILLVSNYTSVLEKMNSFERTFWEEVENFLGTVKENEHNERRRLGSFYNEDDYLSVGDLRDKFVFETKFLPLPDASDWRVTLGAEDTETLRRQTEEHLKEVYAEAAKEPWMRLKKVIDNMTERLSDPDKMFHNTLITNVGDLCDLLPSLNLNNDPVLAQFATEARKKLTGYDPKDLRADKDTRKTVAERAKELSGKVDEYMGAL